MEHCPLIDEAVEIRAVHARFPAFYAIATLEEARTMDAPLPAAEPGHAAESKLAGG